MSRLWSIPRMLVLFSVLLVCMALSSCTVPTSSFYREQNLHTTADRPIYRVVLKNGNDIQFDYRGGRYLPALSDRPDSVFGITTAGDTVTVAVRDILEAEVREREADASGYMVAGSWIALGVELVLFLVMISYWTF